MRERIVISESCEYTTRVVGHGCRLPVYRESLCILHEPDTGKDVQAFEHVLEQKIKEDEQTLKSFTIDLSGVHFPGPIDWRRREFRRAYSFANAHFHDECDFNNARFQRIDFTGAHFHQRAYFRDAQFLQGVDFRRVHFQEVNFWGVQFLLRAHFTGTHFHDTAYFMDTEFHQWAYFRDTQFHQGAVFRGADFRRGSDFREVQFVRWVSFRGAHFHETAKFQETQFGQRANFEDAYFHEEGNFSEVEFQREAYFWGVRFDKDASFENANFHRMANFGEAHFHQGANFQRANFEGYARFMDTRFSPVADTNFSLATIGGQLLFKGVDFPGEQVSGEAGGNLGRVLFRDMAIEQDGKVLLEGTNQSIDLSRASFLGTDLSHLHFRDVRWCTSQENLWGIPVLKVRRSVLFDHLDIEQRDDQSLEHDVAKPTHHQLGELYRQVRVNLEASRQEVDAGEFYIGQMDMRRRDPQFHRFYRFFFLGIYRFIALYGESWQRPLVLYTLFGLIFAWVYVMAGFQGITGPIHHDWSGGNIGWDFVRGYGEALAHALSPGGIFQPDLLFLSWWAPLVRDVNSLLDFFLLGMILVALRRRFRR